MRRALSSLLLVLALAGLAQPFVQAQQNVPACCRRGGQHHCSTSPAGDGYHAVSPCCLYQHFTALTSPSQTALQASAPTMVRSAGWRTSLPIGSPDIARDLVGNAQKRGPPFSQLRSL